MTDDNKKKTMDKFLLARDLAYATTRTANHQSSLNVQESLLKLRRNSHDPVLNRYGMPAPGEVAEKFYNMAELTSILFLDASAEQLKEISNLISRWTNAHAKAKGRGKPNDIETEIDSFVEQIVASRKNTEAA
jgi:hypothetical protein